MAHSKTSTPQMGVTVSANSARVCEAHLAGDCNLLCACLAHSLPEPVAGLTCKQPAPLAAQEVGVQGAWWPGFGGPWPWRRFPRPPSHPDGHQTKLELRQLPAQGCCCFLPLRAQRFPGNAGLVWLCKGHEGKYQLLAS